MRAIVNRAALQGALRKCRKGQRNLPIYSCVRISADDGIIRVEAFDSLRHILVRADGEIVGPGACCVSCEQLMRLLDGSRAETATLNVKDKTAMITTGDVRGTLYGLDLADFPDLESQDSSVANFMATAGELVSILNRVAPAQSLHVVDLYSGIHFRNDDGSSLVMEATDKRRIHIENTSIKVEGQLRAIVASETISLLRFLLEASAEEAVTVSFTPNKIFIALPGMTMRAALIEGTFPNLLAAMPPEREKKCVIPKEPFLAAIDTVARFMGGSGIDSETISISFQNGFVVVSCEVPAVGKCETRLEYDSCEHPIAFRISYIFLRDVVTAVKGDRVTVDYEQSHLPICIRDGDFLAAIAPIRDNPNARHTQATEPSEHPEPEPTRA